MRFLIVDKKTSGWGAGNPRGSPGRKDPRRRLAGDLARCGAPPAAGVRPSIVARPRAAVRRIGPRDRRQVPMRIVPRRVPRLVLEDRSAHASDLRGARVALQVGIACPAGDLWASVRFRESGIVEVFGLFPISHQSASFRGAGSRGGTSRIGNRTLQSQHEAEPTACIQVPARG